jgi:hypothetical protein
MAAVELTAMELSMLPRRSSSSIESGIVLSITPSITSRGLNMPDERQAKVRENRLRRMADRQGYALRKPRRRDPRALDYGELWLMQYWAQDNSGRIELIANPEDSYDAWLGPFRSLDELEEWLTADPETRPDISARKQSGEAWLDHRKQRRTRVRA